MGHDIDGAPALYPGRLVGIDDVDRDAHPDRGALAEPHEIHMDRHVADRIELEIARDDALRGAVDVDIVDAGQKLARIDALAQLGMVQRDVERGLIVAVDDAGHPALATYRPRGPLACPRTCRRLDVLDGRHCRIPLLFAGRAATKAALPLSAHPAPKPRGPGSRFARPTSRGVPGPLSRGL